MYPDSIIPVLARCCCQRLDFGLMLNRAATLLSLQLTVRFKSIYDMMYGRTSSCGDCG